MQFSIILTCLAIFLLPLACLAIAFPVADPSPRSAATDPAQGVEDFSSKELKREAGLSPREVIGQGRGGYQGSIVPSAPTATPLVERGGLIERHRMAEHQEVRKAVDTSMINLMRRVPCADVYAVAGQFDDAE